MPNYTASIFPYVYSLMVIPKKKQDYVVHKVHGVSGTFKTLKELANNVFKDISPTAYGYIEPGHGTKGKKRWITCEADLKEMYVAYGGKKEVLLWCTTDDKCSCVPDKVGTPCKHPKGGHYSHIDKMAAIEEIEEKLRKKHKGVYTEE